MSDGFRAAMRHRPFAGEELAQNISDKLGSAIFAILAVRPIAQPEADRQGQVLAHPAPHIVMRCRTVIPIRPSGSASPIPDGGIDWKLHEAVPLGRDHRGATTPLHILPNEISVIAFVGQEHFGYWSIRVHDRPIALKSKTSPPVRANAMGRPVALLRQCPSIGRFCRGSTGRARPAAPSIPAWRAPPGPSP